MLCGDINYSLRCTLTISWVIAHKTLMGNVIHILYNRSMDLKRGVITQPTMFAGERKGDIYSIIFHIVPSSCLLVH